MQEKQLKGGLDSHRLRPYRQDQKGQRFSFSQKLRDLGASQRPPLFKALSLNLVKPGCRVFEEPKK